MILGIYATSRLLIPLILVLKYYPLRILLLKFAYYLDTNLEWKYVLGVITLSVPKNKFANTLIPLNLSIISSQLTGNTIVVSEHPKPLLHLSRQFLDIIILLGLMVLVLMA